MKFSKILKELQEQNKGYIVLIKNGIFYCGIGKDAVLMNQILNYKPICFKEKICKCGIPVSTLGRVIPQMVETGYSYIIYDYNKETGEYKEIYRIEGHEVYEVNENINCNLCWYNKIKDKNEHEYIKGFGGEYYILKMDVAKYFDNIDKEILLKILKRKIQDPQLLWIIEEILFAQTRPKGLEIRL